MKDFRNIDLHMHSVFSDGTDTPEELIANVKKAGIELFSLTDHDSIRGSTVIPALLAEGDPEFISGTEFSCKDEEGKYHILGYGYDPESSGVREVTEFGHSLRLKKVRARLKFLKDEFHVDFPQEELKKLFALDNPGKPHIGNLMVKYGFAKSKDEAIAEQINKIHIHSEYIRPEEAIKGILDSGGIPVLAHPSYGSGDQLILGEEMDHRLKKLTDFGLQGLEVYYSGFTDRLRAELRTFADKYDLYITAGSDYHGSNKLITLGDTGLDALEEMPERLERFLKDVKGRTEGK